MNHLKFWFLIFLSYLILMSLAAIKLHLLFTLRIGQIFLLILFLFVLIFDLYKKRLDLKILSFLIFSGILFSLISLNSSYYKIGEIKFIVKYLTLFPAAFYLGMVMVRELNIKEIIKLIEIYISIIIFLAIFLYFFPIEFLIHDRGKVELKGTFWEPMGLAYAILSSFLISFSLRFQYKLLSMKIYFFYTFLFLILILTYNKTWIVSITFIILSLIFYKIFVYLKQEFSYLNIKIPKYLTNIKIPHFLIVFFMFISLFMIINNFFLEKPLISYEMLEHKWQSERGKAFRTTLELLEQSNWFGGYGWGFVESYFSTFSSESIIGLGEGVSMLFNSYLDVWLSVGILGLLFHLILLKLAWSNKFLITMTIPLFIFIAANLNPFFGEGYFFLLGFCYGFKKYKG